jgi:hypothetical protein
VRSTTRSARASASESAASSFARLAACVYAEHNTDAVGRIPNRYVPSSLTLAERMGCGERTARKARRELVDAGMLVLDEHPGEKFGVRLSLSTPARTPASGAGVAPVGGAGVEGSAPARTPARTPARGAAGTGEQENRRKTPSGGAAKTTLRGS